MKNCLVLGAGRSGTSLMGGILYHSGYYMGEDLYPSRESNPLGFFENALINGINERILEEYDFEKNDPRSLLTEVPENPYRPAYGQRWLSYIDPGIEITCNARDVLDDIARAVSVPVFAYKDPRFNYTFPVWAPFLPADMVCICMFRDPEVTAESILKDCRSADYLARFRIDLPMIFTLWQNGYRRVLDLHKRHPGLDILFVHYQQLLSKEKMPELSDRLGVRLAEDFIVPELSRSRPAGQAPPDAREMYKALCRLAGFSPD